MISTTAIISISVKPGDPAAFRGREFGSNARRVARGWADRSAGLVRLCIPVADIAVKFLAALGLVGAEGPEVE